MSLTLVTDGSLKVCREHITNGKYDARPLPGRCVGDGGHEAREAWRTRWGPLCVKHLRNAVRIALWPIPLPPPKD